jgi:hypothetical protein
MSDLKEAIDTAHAGMQNSSATFWDGVELAASYEIGRFVGNEVGIFFHEHGVFGGAGILIGKVVKFAVVAAILWLILFAVAQLPFFTHMVSG